MTTSTSAKIAAAAALGLLTATVTLPSVEEAFAQTAKAKVEAKGPKAKTLTKVAEPAITSPASADALILQLAQGIHASNPVARMFMVLDMRTNLAALDVVDRENFLKILSTIKVEIKTEGQSRKTVLVSSNPDVVTNRFISSRFGVFIVVGSKATNKSYIFNHAGNVIVQQGLIVSQDALLKFASGQGFSSVASRGVVLPAKDQVPLASLMGGERDSDFFTLPGAVQTRGKRFPLITPVALGAIKSWGAQSGPYPEAREAMTIYRDGNVKGSSAGRVFEETFIDFNDAPDRMMADFMRILPNLGNLDLMETVAIIAAMSDTDARMEAAIKGIQAGLRATVKVGDPARAAVDALDVASTLTIAKRIVKDYGRDFGAGGIAMPFQKAWVFIQPNDSGVKLAWSDAKLEVGAPMATLINAGVSTRVCNAGGVTSLVGSRICGYLMAYGEQKPDGRKLLDAWVATRALEGFFYKTISLKVGTDSIDAADTARRDPASLLRGLIPTLHGIYLARSLGVPSGFDDAVTRAKRIETALNARTHLDIRRPYDAGLAEIASQVIPLFTAGNVTDFPKLEAYLEYASQTSGNADIKLLHHLVLVAQQKVELGQGPSAPSLEALFGPKPLERLLDNQTANFDQIRIAQKADEVLASGVKLKASAPPAGADVALYNNANAIIAEELRKTAIAAKGTRVLAPEGLKKK
ncbi:MAG: hypothetical protein EBQ96_09630 [Proteobacteria bacterium]|nr:hypothetical protein [Pseudomonadota bacterium]